MDLASNQPLQASKAQGMQAVAIGFNAAIFWALAYTVLVGLALDWKMHPGVVLGYLLVALLQYFLKRGWVRATSTAMVFLMVAMMLLAIWLQGTVSTTHAVLLLIPIFYSVIVLGWRAGLALLLLTVAAAAAIVWAQSEGRLAASVPINRTGQFVVLSAALAVAYRMAVLIKRHLVDTASQKNEAQTQLLAEREQSNALLREAMAELERQKYALDQHAIVVKTDAGRNIIYGNQNFIDVTGYNREELIGSHISMLYSEQHTAAFNAQKDQILDSGDIFHSTVCYKGKQGRLVWMESTIMAVKNEDGSFREHLSVSTDITALREAEHAAQSANQSKSEFLANMSHEIRTPMNGVIGMVEVLRTTPLNPQQRRMVDTVHHSSMTLLQILNDILDFSKIEAGKLATETVVVSLRETVEAVAELMASMASDQQMDFSWYLDERLPQRVRTDPTRVRQILFNLLGNALKFSRQGSDGDSFVRLEVRPGQLPNARPAVEFRIVDNGIGMAPETVERLFDAFVQAEVSIARRYGGTGLGLSITRRLVDLLEGQLCVDSELGVGSEFTVLLPLVKAQDSEVEARSAPVPLDAPLLSAHGEQPLILLVEDNQINRDVILEQLDLLGCAADCAWDGQHGLALWKTGRYALVLTDCHMPGMDGFQMTAAIRAAETPAKRTPIVAITANSMRGEAQRCIAAGMDDYLSKPVRLHELGEVLGRWLRVAATQAVPETPGSHTLPQWDPDAMVRILNLRSEDARNQMMLRFAELTRQHLRSIEALMAQGDLKAVGALTHDVKSSVRTMGAMQMGQVCELLESSCQDGQSEAAKIHLAQLLLAFEDIQQYLPGPID